jgi:hypothetical protein
LKKEAQDVAKPADDLLKKTRDEGREAVAEAKDQYKVRTKKLLVGLISSTVYCLPSNNESSLQLENDHFHRVLHCSRTDSENFIFV